VGELVTIILTAPPTSPEGTANEPLLVTADAAEAGLDRAEERPLFSSCEGAGVLLFEDADDVEEEEEEDAGVTETEVDEDEAPDEEEDAEEEDVVVVEGVGAAEVAVEDAV